jgi:hypothetical protein
MDLLLWVRYGNRIIGGVKIMLAGGSSRVLRLDLPVQPSLI